MWPTAGLRYATWALAVSTCAKSVFAAKDLLFYDDMTYREYKRATNALGYTAHVASPDEWSSMTAYEFAQYKAVIIPDPDCGSLDKIRFLNDTKTEWTPAISGNVIVMGTDTTYHSTTRPGAISLIDDGIRFAAAGPGTGLYFSLSCYYNMDAIATVDALSQIGSFEVRGRLRCYDKAHIVASAGEDGSSPQLETITDGSLSNWACSAHELITDYPSTGAGAFVPVVVLMDAASGLGNGASEKAAGVRQFPDNSSGIPYIIARGATPLGCGNGVVDTRYGEECDNGSQNNGAPGNACSSSCRCINGLESPGGPCVGRSAAPTASSDEPSSSTPGPAAQTSVSMSISMGVSSGFPMANPISSSSSSASLNGTSLALTSSESSLSMTASSLPYTYNMSVTANTTTTTFIVSSTSSITVTGASSFNATSSTLLGNTTAASVQTTSSAPFGNTSSLYPTHPSSTVGSAPSLISLSTAVSSVNSTFTSRPTNATTTVSPSTSLSDSVSPANATLSSMTSSNASFTWGNTSSLVASSTWLASLPNNATTTLYNASSTAGSPFTGSTDSCSYETSSAQEDPYTNCSSIAPSTSATGVASTTPALPSYFTFNTTTAPTSSLVSSASASTTSRCSEYIGIEVIVIIDVVEIFPDRSETIAITTETETATRSICISLPSQTTSSCSLDEGSWAWTPSTSATETGTEPSGRQIGKRDVASASVIENVITTWYMTTTRTHRQTDVATDGRQTVQEEASKTILEGIAKKEEKASGSSEGPDPVKAMRVPYAPTTSPASFATTTMAMSGGGSNGSRSSRMGAVCACMAAVAAAAVMMML